jgi:hypothetical protein
VKGEDINPAVPTPTSIQLTDSNPLNNDYYPQISRWLFILPTFIVFIAILFH